MTSDWIMKNNMVGYNLEHTLAIKVPKKKNHPPKIFDKAESAYRSLGHY